MSDQSQAFWKEKTLGELSSEEWESLCDGCGKCCLVKLQDEETDEVAYTNVVCQYSDAESCRCIQYQHRNELVPHCVRLQPDMVDEFFWLPATCAYRLIAEGKYLESWHPLVSGDSGSVHTSGQSIKDKVYSEQHIHPDELEDYIIHWVE